ncbi:MAG: polysaccharide deacetylase, partial [Firmicutes bacterium]|nr:polysaccharide deacetylase [Bacillota bacterium]
MHRLRSGRLALTLALAIAFAAAVEVFTADVTVSSPALEEGIVYRQVQPCGRTGLTMNVDWGEEELPKILDLLKERNVKITFFVS